MGIIYEPTSYISPDGVEYHFSNAERFIMSETGYGMPEIDYITQQGPYQHGESYLDYRLKPRILQMQFRHNGCSRQDLWNHRQLLVNILRPNRQVINSFLPGKLRKIFPDGSVRDIDVFISSGPVFSERSTDRWDEWSFNESLRFVAPDPTFYDPVQKSLVVSYTISDKLIFYNPVTGASYTGITFYNPVTGPAYDDLAFYTGLIETTGNCVNEGTWITYPQITISGPANGISIINQATNEKIGINYNLPVDNTIIVDLTFGAKRVYISETGANIIGTLTSDSTLASFHLEPDPGAANGLNPVDIYIGNASSGDTAISITWYNRYIGY